MSVETEHSEADKIRETLCGSFCSSLDIQPLPLGGGFSIGSSAFHVWGDNARAYLIENEGRYALRDAGLLLPDLIASGVDFSSDTRKQALEVLLEEMCAKLNESEYEIETGEMSLDEAIASLPKFLVGLARIADLALQNTERTASTFKEDVTRMLRERKPNDIQLLESAPVASFLHDIPADIVLKKPGRVPFGLWLANTERSLFWALLAVSEARSHADEASRPRIAALLEGPKVGSDKTRTMAANRLDALRIYEGDKDEAIESVLRSLDNLPEAA